MPTALVLILRSGSSVPTRFYVLCAVAFLAHLPSLFRLRLAYSLTANGILLQSAVRRRVIPYDQIEQADIMPFYHTWRGLRLAIDGAGYHVGIYNPHGIGAADLAASRSS